MARKARSAAGDVQRGEVERTIDGRIYRGRWEIRGGMFTILNTTETRSKTTQLGGSRPEALAMLMLMEVADPD